MSIAKRQNIALQNSLNIGQIVHQCVQCDVYSIDKDILKRHIGLIHEKRTPLECMLCYAVFIEPKKLKQQRKNGKKPKEGDHMLKAFMN